MNAVILVGHGIKYENAGKSLEQLTVALKSYLPDAFVEFCFLSMSPPAFNETIERCIEKGAIDITLIPYFLLDGYHVQKDIPDLITQLSSKYPEINFKYGDYLGYDDFLVKLLLKRIEQAKPFS